METQASAGARRDSRRYQLALRLMAHQARTGTISAMTNLSRHQQEALRQRWGITEDTRRRGPSEFLESVHSLLESAQRRRRPRDLLPHLWVAAARKRGPAPTEAAD